VYAALDWKGVGRLEGSVLDPDGRPVVDAAVRLAHGTGGGPTARTDKRGRWRAAGLAAGEWTVDVTASGFDPQTSRVTLVSETAAPSPVRVRLARTVPMGPAPEVLATLEKAEEAFREGRWAAAVTQYEALLLMRPEMSTTIHRQLGLAYREQKDYAAALGHLEKVLAADPTSAQVRSLAVRTALEGGMVERARALLAAIDEAAVKRPELFYEIGVGLLNANRPEEAIAYFTKAIAVDPAFVDAWFRRGLAHLQLLRVPECRADLERVLALTAEGPLAEAARQTLAQLKSPGP
jgi:Flp pilus assembly protein TadD